MIIYMVELVWSDNVYHDSQKTLWVDTDWERTKRCIHVWTNINLYRDGELWLSEWQDGHRTHASKVSLV